MAAQHRFSHGVSTTLVVALLGLSLTGCSLRGSGTAMTDSREVEAFESIEIGGAFELIVHVDPAAVQRVEVSGDDNIVPKVTTKVSGGELDVQIDGMVRPKLDLKVEVWGAPGKLWPRGVKDVAQPTRNSATFLSG
jgi:Putative auto-transporter adhesin, head GIN domain